MRGHTLSPHNLAFVMTRVADASTSKIVTAQSNHSRSSHSLRAVLTRGYTTWFQPPKRFRNFDLKLSAQLKSAVCRPNFVILLTATRLPVVLQVVTRGRWKWRTWKWRTIRITRHEIAGHEIDHLAGHEKCRTWQLSFYCCFYQSR